ncbi:ThuA domain-containing protein [Sphingomonas radiodurans]|uniref:ThuA domain-containing protein n=1 Tax=Sphingomonas radiodurans TaxID=2890321 RepID=UPI001E5295C6|nr:ThuA domain-containing protein [Sphingomonas radiodurans]WBH17753.1 ThuA domain-containing protein [Sphingomonas radiodurans]
METIDHHAAIRVLAAVRGHPFDRSAFAALFTDMAGISVTFVDQPAAALLMRPALVDAFDVLLLYDMPGIDFAAEQRASAIGPDAATREGITALLDRGIGVVALHHALAGWPGWEAFAEIIGGRFLYRPATLRGTARLDSGYRHQVHYTAEVAAPLHPVMAGLPATFDLTDELYLAEVFEEDVTPLLRARRAFVRDNFYSATAAIEGRMFSNDGWSHSPGSDAIGWVKKARRSPLVYLQPGDDDVTYTNPNYRRLVENALRWTASPEAHAWAAA